MNCPKCQSDNVYCIDSRTPCTDARRRRYRCENCRNRFSTIELVLDGNTAKMSSADITKAFSKLSDYLLIIKTLKTLLHNIEEKD